MATTEQSFTGNGSTTNYAFTFPYLKSTDITVQLDATATTNWSLANATTVQFTAPSGGATTTQEAGGAPKTGVKIKILRETNVDNLTATFYAGSAIKSEDLNDNYTQNLYVTQEIGNRSFENTGTSTMIGNLNMGEDTSIIFEGATNDDYETTLTVTDPTADRTITIPNVTGTVVTTGDTATVTATMLAANSVDSDELVNGSVDLSHMSANSVDSDQYVDGSIDLAHMSADSVDSDQYVDGSIDRVHLSADIIDGTKIEDNVINSEHYAAGSIDLEHMSANSVDSDQYVDGSIDLVHMSANSVDSDQYVDGSIDTAHIADDQITTAKLANLSVSTAKLINQSVTNAKLADSAVGTDELANDAVTQAKIADDAVGSDQIANNAVTGLKIAADQIGQQHIANDEINSEHIAAGAIDLEHMSSASVDSDNIVDASIVGGDIANNTIADANLVNQTITNTKISASAAIDHSKLAAVSSGQVIVGNGSNVATSVAMSGDVAIAAGGATTIQANSVEIGMIGCEQTTISDSDSHIPTSGAVVDYVASIINPIGGLEVIDDDESFPNTIPAAGVVISITDAAGLSVNSSGVSTNGDALDNSTITINGFPSELRGGVGSNADPYVFQSGAGLMVVSTGSSHTYNYHQAMIREADFVQLSDDINDFNNRYRIASSAPGSANDEGDLYFDTTVNKMYVYDGSAWGQVTSTGDFKYLVPCVFNSGTGNAAVFNGSIDKYDLRENSTSGSLASVTNAAQLMVSINGVVQKPNTGTAISSNDGFCMVDGHTIEFGANIPSGAEVFVIQSGSALTINTPGDGTVTEAKIAVGAVSHTRLAADCVDGDNIQDDVINSEHYAAASIDHEHLANDCVDGDNLADNACDSEHYTDGSIDTAHIANNAITSALIAADQITGAKIADDQIDSEHYAAGSIDLEHMSSESVDEDNLVISNAGSNGQYLQKQSGNNGGLTWATVSAGVTSDGDYNTAGGTNAGDSITSGQGQNNTSFGYNAGTAISTGDANVAIGSQALKTGATCTGNTAVGWRALEDCEDGGEYNTSVGYFAGGDLTTGDNNVAIGASALDAAVTGGGNVAVGSSSLSTNTSGANNTAVGYQSLQLSTTASNNTAVGYGSLYANTEGHSNVAIGNSALAAQQHADCIVAIGKDAMSTQNSTGAGYCIGIGASALKGANTAEHNIAIGYEAMGKADTTGARMIAMGNQALENVTSGSDTIAIGHHAMEAITTGNNTVAIGTYAGEAATDATRNVFVGHQAGKNAASQSYCTYVGYDAGRDNTSSHNTFIGHASGQDNAGTGQGNTCCGSYTMQAGTSGASAYNSCFGYAAGFNLTSGGNNTCIGNSAGKEVNSGSNNIFLGRDAGRSNSPSGSLTTHDNACVLGNDDTGYLYCADSSIDTSDSRDKADITNFTPGLGWIKSLRPVTYKWDKRSWYLGEDETDITTVTRDGSKKKSKINVGFVAQEVLEIEKTHGYGNSADSMLTVDITEDGNRYGLKYPRLVPVLVNAIKELSTKNDALEARIAALEAK